MHVSHRSRVALLTVGGVVLVLALAVGALWALQAGEALPNTSVAGVDVSGQQRDEITDALRPLADEREREPVVATFEDEAFELAPGDIDFAVDLDATVEAALSRGRRGLPGDVVERVRSLAAEEEIPVVQQWDETALSDWVDGVADTVDREESLGTVDIDPETLEVTATDPQGSAEVRRDDARAEVVAALRRPDERELELPVDTTEPPADPSVVADAVEQAEQAVAGPLQLRVDDAELTISPEQLARLVEVVPDEQEARLQLVVEEETVDEVIGEAASEAFDREPREAGYSTSRTPPVQFDDQGDATFSPVEADVSLEPASDGRRFDPAVAAGQLTDLVREGAREAQLRVERVEPELPTEDAEEQRPTHLIGTFTTYYQAGQIRNANIQLLADVIDGTVVPRGEQFSINEVSGERSCAKGYQPAGTIVQGELVDTCGGGTSQFGTTTMNAAFFSGLPLDQYKAHSWYISRYPMGREATLSYPQLDVRFTNETDGAVLVKTDHSATSVTVSVYGQPVADAVSARHGQPANYRGFETERRTTAELPEGQERVLQSGSQGFDVTVTRVIERPDGSVEEEQLHTTYLPQTRIVEVGTG